MTVASKVATDAVVKFGGMQPGATYILIISREDEGSTTIKVMM